MLNYTPNLFRKTTGEPQDLLNFHATIHRVTHCLENPCGSHFLRPRFVPVSSSDSYRKTPSDFLVAVHDGRRN